MKEVIREKTYNTKTAIRLAVKVFGDKGEGSLMLYRRKNGEYFVYSEIGSSKSITPCAPTHAAWFLENLLTEINEQIGKEAQ
jgi:hypothetical protein